MQRRNYDNNDITLEMLHRASVVANTRIRYNDKQLLQMIHEHLVMSGELLNSVVRREFLYLHQTILNLKGVHTFVGFLTETGNYVSKTDRSQSKANCTTKH